MKLSKLKINEWKQFDHLEIDFHPRLTVLTGANGAGKTTLLNILARHFGWNINELSTPAKDKESGLVKFFSRYFKFARQDLGNVIGELQYSNDAKTAITIQDNDQPTYGISFPRQQNLKGINIPSHRELFFYKQVSQLATQKRKKDQAFNLVSNSIKNRSQGGSSQPTNYFIKETLLSWAIAGSGNEFIDSDPELIKYFRGFEDVLHKILPDNLGFEKFVIRNYEVVLITRSGDFMIDAVSGGISSLIDLAWQIFMFPKEKEEAITVLVDEVENHLHANMQRSILPDLLDAFPNIQFVVSTHSPLVVGSVKDSNVYALRYDDQHKVFSQELDLVNKAKSATEILHDILGVPFTMPVWVEKDLNRIINKYSNEDVSKQMFDNMREELSSIGLENLMPLAVKESLEGNDG